jgi:Holliday junction resolvasome RuvABC endonuclease subunit
VARIKGCAEEQFARAAIRGEKVVLLGLDPGESFGFAVLVLEGGKFELRGSMSWRLDKGMRFCSRGASLMRLGGHLIPEIEIWQRHGPMILVYETARFFKSVCQAQSSAAFGAHVQFICEEKQVPFINLEPSEVKKWAGGKGNASKDVIRHSMIQVFGERLKKGKRTEDEFDAIAVAYAQARKAGWVR